MVHSYDASVALVLDMAARALRYFGVKARRLLAAEIRIRMTGHAGCRLDTLMGCMARLALIRELLVGARDRTRIDHSAPPADGAAASLMHHQRYDDRNKDQRRYEASVEECATLHSQRSP
jgi:hypothetical protein